MSGNARGSWLNAFANDPNQKDDDQLLQEAFGLLRREYARFPLVIRMPIKDLKTFQNTKELIPLKGFIGKTEIDFLVSCGHFRLLQVSEDERKNGFLNLIDHLNELVPKNGTTIGLVTFQNGILNDFNDFKLMGKSIVDKIPEGTLCIGLYNVTFGVHDMNRLSYELRGGDSHTICRTLKMWTTLGELLPQINRDLVWAHIAHSEGGPYRKTSIAKYPTRNEIVF